MAKTELAEPGDRVVREIKIGESVSRWDRGEIVDQGAKGYEIRFDRTGATNWLPRAHVKFIHNEGTPQEAFLKDRPQPMASHVAKQKIEAERTPPAPPPPPPASKPDPIDLFLAAGGDLFELHKSLGARLPEIAQREYDHALAAKNAAEAEHTYALGLLKEAKEKLEGAERAFSVSAERLKGTKKT